MCRRCSYVSDCYGTTYQLKKQKNRKPLIIEGARQTGKTWLMKEFGILEYTDTVYINFDSNKRMEDMVSSDLNTERLIGGLPLYAIETIVDVLKQD